MDFSNRKTQLMRELWKLSEEVREAGDADEAAMIEAAGNVVENTFCVGDPADLALSAIADAMEDR